jgi:hypothetical protein
MGGRGFAEKGGNGVSGATFMSEIPLNTSERNGLRMRSK